MTGKERVEQDIDQCILESRSYADFKKRLVRDYDYQLREGVSREHGVYLALTPPGRGKAIRTYRLSEGYMPADIDRRIASKTADRVSVKGRKQRREIQNLTGQ